MKKQEFIKKMKNHENKFDELWQEIVKDTNNFVQENPEVSTYSLVNIEKFTDQLCLSGAWITDRINGKSGVYSSPKYRGSLSKKIRKALGYTY